MMIKLPFFVSVTFVSAFGCAQTVSLPEPPEVQAKNHVVSLTLHAVNENGRDAFAFNGETVAPVIRASPGEILKITYINDLPSKSPETCAINPCMDMTTLHFHGLSASPDAPQDDVGVLSTKQPNYILSIFTRFTSWLTRKTACLSRSLRG